MMFTATRYHDFSYGHRVAGHENKCAQLHGHNGRIWFHCRATGLDALGRVIDFSGIKERLCQWVEDNWDHQFLVWHQDTLMHGLREYPGITAVPFNPTAENMAEYLVTVVGPAQLEGTDVELYKCTVDETRKCSATYEKESNNG